jgi:hypothetical protein
MAGAAKALLRVPKARGFEEPKPKERPLYPKGVRYAEAALEPLALQDFVEVLPDVLKAAAGVSLKFRLHIVIHMMAMYFRFAIPIWCATPSDWYSRSATALLRCLDATPARPWPHTAP